MTIGTRTRTNRMTIEQDTRPGCTGRSDTRASRSRTLTACVALALAALVAVSLPAAAGAGQISGTGQDDRVVGTNKQDTIRLKGGDDRARARGAGDKVRGAGGKDRLRGNGGRDRLAGGNARDRLLGGAGRDFLNAADGGRDAVINGGAGRDTCRVDRSERNSTDGCEQVRVASGGGSGGGGNGGGSGGGGNGGGGNGGGGNDDGLTLTSAAGFTCDDSDVACLYGATGKGADSLVTLTDAGGGVTLNAGAELKVNADRWRANGGYQCSSDGFIRFTIGDESLTVPVNCV